MRLWGSGMRTASSSDIVRSRASLFDRSRCTRMLSAIWAPTFITGLRAVIGSWKIIAISVAHRPRYSASDRSVMSRPLRRTVPDRSTLRRGVRPMIERLATDLPEPDSPTMPSVLPRSTVRLSPSTARTMPRGVLNAVWRSVTSSRGAVAEVPSAEVSSVGRADG